MTRAGIWGAILNSGKSCSRRLRTGRVDKEGWEMDFEYQDIAKVTAPMELSRPLPREIRLTSEGVWRASSAAVLLLIGFGWALLILAGYVNRKQHYAELAQRGLKASANVDRIDNSGVYYSFAVNGVTFHGKSGIPASFRSHLQEAGRLSIMYLPSNPRINHAADWQDSPIQGLGIIVLPVLVTALGVWVAQDLRKTRRVLRDGAVAAGIVKESSLYNRTGEITVTYEFKTPNGGSREGMGWSEGPLKPGKQIWILYLPDDPSVSTSYPLHHWRMAS
jgi:hypothetical protein